MITNKTHRAQVYALNIHKNQEYGFGVPYSVHFNYVVMMAIKFIHNVDEELREDVICACYLHDTIEDSGTPFNELKKEFGGRIAELVYSVTNELGHDRIEKAQKTIPKIIADRNALFIKLCDKIANVSYSKLTKNKIYDMYVSEHAYFKEMLYKENEYSDMWNYLEELNLEGNLFSAESIKKIVSEK